jgi:hypothetical protein
MLQPLLPKLIKRGFDKDAMLHSLPEDTSNRNEQLDKIIKENPENKISLLEECYGIEYKEL